MADVCENLGGDALKGVSFEHLESLLSFVVCVFVNVLNIICIMTCK